MAQGEQDWNKRSILDNSSVDLSKQTEIVTALTNIQDLAGSVTLDFNDTTNNKVFKQLFSSYSVFPDPVESGTELTSLEYSQLNQIDNLGPSYNGVANVGFPGLLVRFTLESSYIGQRTKISSRIFAGAVYPGGAARAYIYNNNTNSWDQFFAATLASAWADCIFAIDDNTNYVDGSNRMYILFATIGELLLANARNIRLDYAALIIYNTTIVNKVKLYGTGSNLTSELIRVCDTVKYKNASTAGDHTVWTPATGKKFRLLAFDLDNATGTQTILLKDGSTTIERHTMGNNDHEYHLLPTNGYLSTTANNSLVINLANATNVDITVYGMEE